MTKEHGESYPDKRLHLTAAASAYAEIPAYEHSPMSGAAEALSSSASQGDLFRTRTAMNFRLLGPVEIWLGARRLEGISGKQRTILAILLLTPGTVVHAESLIDRLWGDLPPAKARESLSAYIARLRRSLRPGGDEVQITARARGYVLEADPDSVDLQRFRELRRRTGTLAEADEIEQAVALAREAEDLWRGEALAGIRGDWIAGIRHSISEERRALLADRMKWELALGRHASLTGELTSLLAQHPLDETLIACQMTALYRCGRSADALGLYRETRDQFVNELGAEPGPALTALHQRILRRDPTLTASPHQGRPARLTIPVPAARETHSPKEPDAISGRPATVTRPRSRAKATQQVDRRYPPETSGATATPELTLPADHGTYSSIADEAVGNPPRPTAQQGLVRRPLKHDLISPQSTAAFDAAYQALVPQDQVFLRRIGLSPGPVVTAGSAAALAGVPLAKARSALAVLVDLRVLASGPGGQFAFADTRELAAIRAAERDSLPARRQAVRRLLDYYLTAGNIASQVLFPRRHQIEGPSTCPPEIIPSLASSEEAEEWLAAECPSILQAARYAASHRWPRQCADLTYLVTHWLEVRGRWDEAIAACSLAVQASHNVPDPARIARASLDLAAISQQAGHRATAAGLASQAAEIYRALGDQQGLAQAVDQVGQEHLRSGRAKEALAYFAEARAMYNQGEDAAGISAVLNHAAIACWHLGRYPEALTHLNDALTLCRDIGDRRGEAKTLSNLGTTQVHTGHYQDALASLSASLTIFEDIGGAQSQAILRHLIGGVHHRTGSHSQAIAALHQALALYRDIGDLPDEADVHNDIGAVYRDADLHDEALSHYDQARQIARRTGNQTVQVIALRGIADICRDTSLHHDAHHAYQDALHLARQINDPFEEAKSLAGLAETALSTGDPHNARIIFRQAQDIFDRLGLSDAHAIQARLDSIPPTATSRTSLPAPREPTLSQTHWAH